MIGIEELLSLSIVGAILSLIIQFVKTKISAEPNVVKAFTIVLSLLIGSFYYLLSDTEFFVAVIGILTTSSTVWALLIKGSGIFESKD
jgi:hypothetical protein